MSFFYSRVTFYCFSRVQINDRWLTPSNVYLTELLFLCHDCLLARLEQLQQRSDKTIDLTSVLFFWVYSITLLFVNLYHILPRFNWCIFCAIFAVIDMKTCLLSQDSTSVAFDGLNGGASFELGSDSEQEEEDDEIDENSSSCLSNQPPSSVNALIAAAPAASRCALQTRNFGSH